MRIPAASTALLIFLSSNLANLGNLVFNMLFGRWMNPTDFALLAACLTVLLGGMGLLEALRMAASHQMADAAPDRRAAQEAALARLSRRALLPGLILSILGAAAWLALQGRDAAPWVLLFMALPVAMPLSILRGLALGRMQAVPIVVSGQAEMLFRLLGAVLAWQAGLGMGGVVLALALSIGAAWLVLDRTVVMPAMRRHAPANLSIGRLVVASLPFVALQAAQLGALDADVLLAWLVLPADQTGLVAALCLFQRVQFYACFGLASVLLPAVALARAQGAALGPAIQPIILLSGAVAATCLLAATVFPTWVLNALVGPQYAAAATGLGMASAAAALFTFGYMAATLMLAQGDWRGLAVLTAGAACQGLAIIALPHATLEGFLITKLVAQGVTALGLVVMLLLPGRSQHPQPTATGIQP
ncbi:MATE family efflux transporter [Paracoccus sediminilitoris]|uniref:hypothetical protein n=1 Tax=Paracoccus sediminilitoris TaxID=2202419 RepID=UPI000DB984AD|nr:hypothetical protein [Paracoccus sediminilitoris]